MNAFKTLSILFNINKCNKNKISTWIEENHLKSPVFITNKESNLIQMGLPYPVFSIETLISISSSEEESIYQKCHHYRNFFIKKCPIFFDEMNLLEDEIRGFNFEMAMRYMAAYLKLREKFDHVIIALSYDGISESLEYLIAFKALIEVAKSSEKTYFLIFSERKGKFVKKHICFYSHYINLYLKKALSKKWSLRGQVVAEAIQAKLRFSLNWFITYFGGLLCFANNPPYRLSCQRKLASSFLGSSLDPANKSRDDYTNPCLFFTTSVPLYRNNFTPIYEKLSIKLKKNPLSIASTRNVAKYCKATGIKTTSSRKLFFNFLSPIFIICAFFAVMHCIYLKYFYVIQCSRLYLKDPVSEVFRQQMISLLLKDGLLLRFSRSLLKTKKIDFFLKAHKPTIIYKEVAHSNYDARIAKLAAKHRIPVITSIIASITSRYRNFGIYPCDFITILGENQREILKKRGYCDEQIIPVGQPELDIAKEKWNTISAKTYISEHIPYYDPEKFMLLISTGYVDLEHEKEWIKIISDYAAQQKNAIQIFIKPHPSVGNFYEDCTYLNYITVLPNDIELYPFLVAANLVATDASHSGKLAIFFKKPLMVVNFSGKKFPYNNFDEEGVAWLATNQQEIYETIEEVLNQKLVINTALYNNYIQQHLTSDDGKASDRIIDFLLQF